MSNHNKRSHSEDEYIPRAIIRERSTFTPFVLGAIVGGAIGAALALLYAPAEGTELRKGINDTLGSVSHGVKEIVRGVSGISEKLFADGLATDEEDSQLTRTRERADDILEDADRAIAEARRRTNLTNVRQD